MDFFKSYNASSDVNNTNTFKSSQMNHSRLAFQSFDSSFKPDAAIDMLKYKISITSWEINRLKNEIDLSSDSKKELCRLKQKRHDLRVLMGQATQQLLDHKTKFLESQTRPFSSSERRFFKQDTNKHCNVPNFYQNDQVDVLGYNSK